jgi:hypothetical protein
MQILSICAFSFLTCFDNHSNWNLCADGRNWWLVHQEIHICWGKIWKEVVKNYVGSPVSAEVQHAVNIARSL